MKEIFLTQGKIAIVDDKDYADLSQFNWCAFKSADTFYAGRSIRRDGKQTTESMHRRILNARSSQDVDHRNHNGLDNRRENIRICTPSQNGGNRKKNINGSSRFKGISWDKASGKWLAHIQHNGKLTYLGSFEDQTVAAHAYDKTAKELFREFASLNFPV